MSNLFRKLYFVDIQKKKPIVICVKTKLRFVLNWLKVRK